MGENKPKVIVIPAVPKNTGPAEQRQLRVAAYCRVSTKEEDQLNSYEAQKNYYTDKIMENKSWTMADIFADEGITGTSAKKRADFMRMMKWCKQGKIDLILTKSVSRFARNTVDCLNYVRMLKAQGIAVYFEKENINSMDESTELMLTMMGAFAQAESESISGNIQAGKRYAMQRGEATINYYNLYAYEKGPDGNPQIIPEQAKIVREIYQKYLHGDSLNMIRKDLEERHIPNARGGATWTHTAVRGILSNEKYVGDVLMQKTFQQDCSGVASFAESCLKCAGDQVCAGIAGYAIADDFPGKEVENDAQIKSVIVDLEVCNITDPCLIRTICGKLLLQQVLLAVFLIFFKLLFGNGILNEIIFSA